MKISIKNNFILFVILSILSSCASKKDLVYLQGIDNQKNYDESLKYEHKLQPDDLLSIIVSAENPEVTAPFNLPQVQGSVVTNSIQNIKTYLIDNDGFINYPILGRVQLGGLTRTEAVSKLSVMISNYIENPSINLKIMNYKISVLGEVAKPGTYNISSERITLLEALSLAGDLGLYGKRKNILIIHEDEGKKTFTRLDLTDPSILNSPSYYLAQNDVIVVEPNQTRINGSVVGPNVTVLLSGISILLSLIIFIKNF